MQDAVLERIKLLLQKRNISMLKISEASGIKQNTFSRQISGKNALSSEVILSILGYFPDVSSEWLLRGIGDANDRPMISYSKGRPYYNVDFLGGFDLSAPDNTVNPDYNIDYQPYNKDGVIWCNITGESMEPKINSGDKIALTEVLDWNQCIVCGEIYAIITKNNLRTVKIISKDSGDEFILKAINKEFHPQPIKKNMITKVFKVMGCIKAF